MRVDRHCGEHLTAVSTRLMLGKSNQIVRPLEILEQAKPIDIEDCVYYDFNIVLPGCLAGRQQFLFGSPSGRSRTFLEEFSKIPLFIWCQIGELPRRQTEAI